MDLFREFVKKHPGLKDEVKNNNLSWQNIYEEWYLYGEDSSSFVPYKNEQNNEFKKNNETSRLNTKELSPETLKNVMNYIKKINPDNLTKTLSSAQKIMAIIQGFIGGTASGAGLSALNKMTGDPLFDKKFDEWY